MERISDAPIHSNQMVSFDVVSLFTKVPTDETFAVVRDKLAADPLLGLPLSPVLANIYMEYFKEMALGSTSLKPSMWLSYVDDTFILWFHQDNVQTSLDQENSIRPSLQFTMEKEQDKLPFLDVLVTCRAEIQVICVS